MSRFIFSFIVFCFSFTSFSQSVVLSGSVVEEGTLTKLSNAIVSINGTSIVQTTNENGEFEFLEGIPSGEQFISILIEGYESRLELLNIVQGQRIVMNPIQMEMTKQEKKRRKKEGKSLSKEEKKKVKERDAKIKEAQKDMEKSEKQLAKDKKKLRKNSAGVVVTYETIEAPVEAIPVKVETVEVAADYSSLQIKYANFLDVTPDVITNTELYEFIDIWMGTPYKMGGGNKDGIDCSSFTQLLFIKVYDQYIERTAESQKSSQYTDPFDDTSYLQEGDLLFFGMEDINQITHVGVYLGNNKFVNSTARKTDGKAGVKIDDLSDAYWRSIFCCAGRRINNN